MMRGLREFHIWVLAASSAGLLGGCDRDEEIRTYGATGEAPPAVAADPHAGVPMPDPGQADPHAALPIGRTAKGKPAVDGEVPAGWKRGRGSSLRLASYVAEGEGGTLADISLIVLKGQAGGVLGNINRWRAQLGLDPVDEQGLAESSTKLTTPLGEAVVVDVEAVVAVADKAKDGRIVAAVVPADGEMWFYKMRGNVELVGLEKEGFLKWISTARRAEPAAPPKPVDGPADAGAPAPPDSPD